MYLVLGRYLADGCYVAIYFCNLSLTQTSQHVLSISYMQKSCPRNPFSPPPCWKGEGETILRKSHPGPAWISTYGLACPVLKLFDSEELCYVLSNTHYFTKSHNLHYIFSSQLDCKLFNSWTHVQSSFVGFPQCPALSCMHKRQLIWRLVD